jgi:hypothetical protein
MVRGAERSLGQYPRAGVPAVGPAGLSAPSPPEPTLNASLGCKLAEGLGDLRDGRTEPRRRSQRLEIEAVTRPFPDDPDLLGRQVVHRRRCLRKGSVPSSCG